MISSQQINKYTKVLQHAKAKLATIKEHAEETMGRVFQTVEVGGATFAWSYFNAKNGDLLQSGLTEIQVMGLPADLGAFVALQGLSLFGALGKYAEHGSNVADGSLAPFLARMGMTMGAKARTTPAKPAQGFHFPGQPASLGATTSGVGVPAGWAPQRQHQGSFGYG